MDSRDRQGLVVLCLFCATPMTEGKWTTQQHQGTPKDRQRHKGTPGSQGLARDTRDSLVLSLAILDCPWFALLCPWTQGACLVNCLLTVSNLEKLGLRQSKHTFRKKKKKITLRSKILISRRLLISFQLSIFIGYFFMSIERI